MSGAEHAPVEKDQQRKAQAQAQDVQQIAQRMRGTSGMAAYILHLQRTIGNQAVGRLLRQYEAQQHARGAGQEHRLRAPVIAVDNGLIVQASAAPPVAVSTPIGVSGPAIPAIQRKFTDDQGNVLTPETVKAIRQILEESWQVGGQIGREEEKPKLKDDAYAQLQGFDFIDDSRRSTRILKFLDDLPEGLQLTAEALTKIRRLVPGSQPPAQVAEMPAPAARPAQDPDIMEGDQRERDLEFERLAAGDIDIAEAPTAIRLPGVLTEGVAKRWQLSVDEKEQTTREHGGILLKDKGGRYIFRPSGGGSPGEWNAETRDLQNRMGETLIGSGHTHPYLIKNKVDLTKQTLSGGDLKALVPIPEHQISNPITKQIDRYPAWQEKIVMAQSGNTQFVVAKTRQFDQLVTGTADRNNVDSLHKMQEEIKSKFKELNDAEVKKHPTDSKNAEQDAIEVALKQVCKLYHLLY